MAVPERKEKRIKQNLKQEEQQIPTEVQGQESRQTLGRSEN